MYYKEDGAAREGEQDAWLTTNRCSDIRASLSYTSGDDSLFFVRFFRMYWLQVIRIELSFCNGR